MAEEEQPKNVKELLVELKDASELMVDLAYAAVFFNENSLAEEVEELEQRMDGHLRRLREVAMLAARSPEDAEAMAGVLHIAAAIEKIGDAASDIARVVQARLGIPDTLRPDLRHADEIAGRVTSIARRSTLGRPLGLAFVRPDLARPGGRVTIRAAHGHPVRAEVVNLPFYDAENRRQQ